MIAYINTILTPLENIIRQYRRHIGYCIVFLALLAAIYLSDISMIRSSGEKAIIVLWIILWMPILARVFGIRIFAQLLPLRRELGVLMGVLAVVHGLSYLIPFGETMELFSDGKPSFLLFGIIAMWLSVPLTLTSSTWAMRKMGKKWKLLHRLVYILVIFAVAHVVILKSVKHFEIAPVIFLGLYFFFKMLEWRGYSFAKKNTEN